MVIIFFSCNESEITSCESENPINDLEWLYDEIESIKSHNEHAKFQVISSAVYEGNMVFLFGNCCPNCNTATPVKNCFGEQVGVLGGEEGSINFDALKELKTLWKSTDSACNN